MNDFVKNTNHIRVESSLAGRQVAVGFLGWLTSHGINYGGRRAALSGVMRSSRAGVRALAEEGITHITVDPASTKVFDVAYLDTFADYEVGGRGEREGPLFRCCSLSPPPISYLEP